MCRLRLGLQLSGGCGRDRDNCDCDCAHNNYYVCGVSIRKAAYGACGAHAGLSCYLEDTPADGASEVGRSASRAGVGEAGGMPLRVKAAIHLLKRQRIQVKIWALEDPNLTPRP
eukprot:5754985-Pyramimonas_sp.AAC.1